MLCGPLSSNTKLPLAMPSHLLQFDARNMYSSLKHRDQQQQGPHFTRSEVGLRSDAKTDYGRFPIAIAVTTNSSSSRDAQFRLLQKRFSSLCEIGVIKETDASDRPDAISRGQKNTAAANGKTRGHNTVENPATNGKSRTEVSLYLGRSPSSSAEANTYDKKVVVERPSEETIAPSQLNTSELQYSKPFTSAITRRASVQHISSYVKQKVNTDRGGIKIRKMSAPSQSLGILINHNRSASIESLGKTTDNRDIDDTGWNTLDDTQLQWEKLVARARSFQTHLASSPVPERAHSRFDRKDNKEARAKTENVAQIQAVAEDDEISEDGSELSDVSSEASHTSNSSSSASGSTTCLTETFGLLAKPITKSSNPESESEKQVTEETEITKGETDVTESVNASLDNDKTVKNNETIEDNSVASHRRFSLATLRPQTESVERISGYSTHGALEYAKKLLGRIQTEGKTKTKKERLEGMSKALKLVLEELNRIESPDRELVSLFISLRAKIVNLRAEVKNEESDGSGDEKQSEKTRVGISQTVPSPDEGNRDNLESPSHARRFSWC